MAGRDWGSQEIIRREDTAFSADSSRSNRWYSREKAATSRREKGRDGALLVQEIDVGTLVGREESFRLVGRSTTTMLDIEGYMSMNHGVCST